MGSVGKWRALINRSSWVNGESGKFLTSALDKVNG